MQSSKQAVGRVGPHMPPGRLVGGTPTTDSAGVGVRLSLPGTSRATLVGDERNIVSNVDAVNSGDLILPLSVIRRVDPMPKEAYDSNVRRITETEAGRCPLQIKATCRTDLCSHHCVQLLDIRCGKGRWRALNFYNDVADPTALNALGALYLDPMTPTLIVGDFNTHSPWLPEPGWDKSPHADRLEE